MNLVVLEAEIKTILLIIGKRYTKLTPQLNEEQV